MRLGGRRLLGREGHNVVGAIKLCAFFVVISFILFLFFNLGLPGGMLRRRSVPGLPRLQGTSASRIGPSEMTPRILFDALAPRPARARALDVLGGAVH